MYKTFSYFVLLILVNNKKLNYNVIQVSLVSKVTYKLFIIIKLKFFIVLSKGL